MMGMTGRQLALWFAGAFVLGVASSYAGTWLWNRGRCGCRRQK